MMSSYRMTVILSLCSAIVLAIVGLVANRRLSDVDNDARLVAGRQVVIGDVERILSLGVDAEDAVRGFVISGDAAFLESFNNNRPALERQVLALQSVVEGDAEQTARVGDLAAAIRLHMTLLDDIVERRRASGFDDARQVVMDGGMRPLDRARTIGASVCAAEESALSAQRARLAARSRSLRFVTWAASGSALLALVFAGVQVGAELGRRRRAEVVARQAYDQVENTVRARTEELQTAVEQLHMASHLRNEFLATVSHELRTPLNAIVGWAHVLTLAEVGVRERDRAVEAIARNAKIQTRLIEDLLDVSNMMRGRLNILMSRLDLRVVLQEVVETVSAAARARQVQLDVRVDDEPMMIDGDHSRLQQIAWNLLTNAVKFTPNAGTVHASVTRAGNTATLRVQDTGEGIAPDFLNHVFEPFRQGHGSSMRTGLGLGLAIVRPLVELHGGVITAESDGMGCGSVFVVTLPLRADGELSPEVHNRRAATSSLEGVRVLVAEDDEDSGAALGAVLRGRGCIVRVARTASACLTMLAEAPVDVLLFDIGLPDDDGYSLLRRARDVPESQSVPAIALTAFAGENERVRALAAGFTAHVPKPFDTDTIVREIVRATDRHSG